MKKEQFHLPEGVIYLDGNSLGPLPKNALSRIGRTVSDEWGELLIRGWNEAGWMQQPSALGDKLGSLIGCPAGTVVLGDTLSIKVFQALSAAVKLRPGKKVILSDTGNFPTDLYMAEGLIKMLGDDYELRLVEPEEVMNNLTDDLGVLMLTHVDYRTGRLHNMNEITKAAHKAGAVVIWDLAHSAGALPVDMAGSNAEFAVGCTYKYLNGGPGAPAFIYARPDIADSIEPALSGWLGHDAPFAFEPNYRPAGGIERMRVGTPPVIQMAALEAALSLWDDVSMADVREKSIKLSELFIREVEARCPQLELMCPRDPQARGSQVSFAFEHGYAVVQALIADGVVGDFRAPNIMRFGFTPLYVDEEDVIVAAKRLESIMSSGKWNQPQYHKRSAVT